MCQDCWTFVEVQAFAAIFTAVFAGLVSGVTGNLLFKSYCVLFSSFCSLVSFFMISSDMNFALPSAFSVLLIRDSYTSQKYGISRAFFSIAFYFPMNVFYACFCTFSESSQRELWIWISSSDGLVFKPVWHSVGMRFGVYEIWTGLLACLCTKPKMISVGYLMPSVDLMTRLQAVSGNLVQVVTFTPLL